MDRWPVLRGVSHKGEDYPDYSGALRGYRADEETKDDAEAPKGWTKWTIPVHGFNYLETGNGYMFFSYMDIMSILRNAPCWA